MAVIILLIVFSLVVAIIFLAAFVWSVKSGQFEDTVSPSIRILFDEKKGRETVRKKEESNGSTKK